MRSVRITLKPTDNMRCPYCGYTYDEPASDFVVPGCNGTESASEERCPDCDEWMYPYLSSKTGEIVV